MHKPISSDSYGRKVFGVALHGMMVWKSSRGLTAMTEGDARLMQIWNMLKDSLSSGDVLLPILMAAAALLFNYKKIIEFIEERQKARVAKLSEALKCEHISGLTKSHLEEELATEHFKIATGMRAEKAFREAVIQAHQNTQGELRFVHFKRALPLIFYEDAKLAVKITRFDLFDYWLNFIFGCALVIEGALEIIFSMGLLGMALSGQFKGINIIQALTMLGAGASIMAIALFVLWQTFPVISARKVAKELEKQRNNAVQPSAN